MCVECLIARKAVCDFNFWGVCTEPEFRLGIITISANPLPDGISLMIS